MAVAGNIVIEMAIDDKMSVSVKRAGTVLQEFQGALNKTASSVKHMEDASESLSTKFRHMVVMLGNLRFVAMDVNDIFLRLPMAIMKSAGELERTQALLGGLSKEFTKAARDAEAASNFKYITTMAQQAPFAIAALSDAFVKFKSAGLDPTNGSMKALVDGVAKFGGNGESLHRASIAIQQMAGKGVVSMEELRQQLGEAVPTAMEDMATGMGMSMADLTKAVSKGTVEATDAINKMLVIMGQNNEGASQNMMNTWVGVQEILKTRMQLAAKDIADAGFGDATKKVAREISNALESIEFRQFAEGTGAVLADTVESISAIVKALIEYGTYIKYAAEAWFAYKLVTVGVMPLTTQLISQVKSMNGEYKNQQAILGQTAAAAKAAAMTQTSAAVDTARVQMTASADTMTALKKELAAHEERRVIIQRNFAETNKTLQEYQPKGSYGGLDRTAVQEYARNLAKLDADNAATMRSIRGQIETVSASHAEAAQNVMKHGTHLDQLAGQSNRASAAMTAMSAAGRMAGNAFDLLGGWATVLNVAIAAGIALWHNWGNAASDAVARARRAKAGLADEEDVKGLQNDKYNLNSRLRAAEGELEADTNNRWVDKKGAAYKKKQEAVARLEAEGRMIDENLAKARASSTRQIASVAAQDLVRATDVEIDQINKQKTKRLLAQDQVLQDELIAAGTNKAKQDAAHKKNQGARMDIDVEFGGQKAATINKQLADLTSQFKGPNADAAVEAAGVLRDKLVEAQDGITRAIAGKGENKILNAKGAGVVKDSPIEKVIKQLADERSRLTAELSNFDRTKGEVDKVAGIIAEMNQKLANGELNNKGVKPSAEKFQQLVNEAIVVERLREAAKQQAEDASKAASDLQKATSFIEGMRPDVEQAMELLVNPMGTAMRGANEAKVERWIAKNTDAIQRYAEQQKITVEKVKETLKGDATFVDVMKTFSDVETETRRLNASMVSDDRNAVAARMKASNAEYALKLRNLINLRTASGATTAEIEQLEKLAADNTIARANEVARASQSPMEKMAEQWKNSSKNMEDATARWATSSVDAFINLAKTGKMEWGSLADSIISDILRIAIQKQMADSIMGASSWISSILPFANGGIMSSEGSMPLKKYAAGGIANSPQMAMFGEGSMNEAYVPLPDGRTIPVTMKGVAGGGGGNMVVNIIEAPGKGGQTSSRQEGGTNIMDIMVEKVSNKIAGDITRGSGAVNGAITSTFGLNRVAGAY
jgi:tape measure domain-containing protein